LLQLRTCYKAFLMCVWKMPRNMCGRRRRGRHFYDRFHWKCNTPEILQIDKLRFLGISRYKFKLRFWFLDLYRGTWVSWFGGFWGSSSFSGNCYRCICCIESSETDEIVKNVQEEVCRIFPMFEGTCHWNIGNIQQTSLKHVSCWCLNACFMFVP